MSQPSLFGDEPEVPNPFLLVPAQKPMLAAKIKTEADFAGLVFPILCSQKHDGLCNTVQSATCLSRTLIHIPNRNVQAYFGQDLLNGFHGEFIDGDPFAKDVFSRTNSVVTSLNAPIDTLTFNVFDSFGTSGFKDRLEAAENRIDRLHEANQFNKVLLVPHVLIENMEGLLAYEEEMLDLGAEGIMERDPEGLYKHGRSTLRERGLAAIKRFVDAEAIVISCYEQEENRNAKVTNELGLSKRSTRKAGKFGKNTLGGFHVVANPGDKETVAVFGTTAFKVGCGLGLTNVLRQELWDSRDAQAGKIEKFKYQAAGVKDKPRIPVWLGFRDPMDIRE